MNALDNLKPAEAKMDRTVVAYSQEKWVDPELHKRRIDDLTRATIEFLEVREEVFRGRSCEKPTGRVA